MADIGDGEEPTGSLLEGLAAAMPDAVVGTDAEFRVTVWNAGAQRLYTRGAHGRQPWELTLSDRKRS
jgi:PAS domain-containing protein